MNLLICSPLFSLPEGGVEVDREGGIMDEAWGQQGGLAALR